MDGKLTTELFWLTATVTMTALFWIPYILNRVIEQGGLPAIWDPLGITQTKVAWADRMMRAHNNAIENLVIFASLVIVLHLVDVSTMATTTACIVYFYARLAHYLVFTFKVPVLRIAMYLTGFGSQMVLALTLFGLI